MSAFGFHPRRALTRLRCPLLIVLAGLPILLGCQTFSRKQAAAEYGPEPVQHNLESRVQVAGLRDREVRERPRVQLDEQRAARQRRAQAGRR